MADPVSGPVEVKPGLPPVAPPSGKFILQLFVVPLVIVGVAVLFALFWNWMAGGSRSPAEFVRKLDDPNPEVRWRAASDLAQHLLRDDNLASDGRFALQLSDRLGRAVEANAADERALAERLGKLSLPEAKSERARRESERNYILFLSACLGNFMVPAGVPVLRQLAEQETGLEPTALMSRRWQSLWALANLGQNLKRFDKLTPVEQEAALARLEQAEASQDRTPGLAETLVYLKDRRDGKPNALGVDRTLEKCADDPNPFLREQAAFALGFWNGTPAENERMERTLLRLVRDRGRGEELLDELYAADPSETRALVKAPGFKVYANAALVLARRGSAGTPADVLLQLLDEDKLREICVVVVKETGREQPDDAMATDTVISTLKALVTLHQKRPDFDFGKLTPAVEKLGQSGNPAIQAEARQTLIALGNP